MEKDKEVVKSAYVCPKCGGYVSIRKGRCVDEYWVKYDCTKCDWHDEKEVG